MVLPGTYACYTENVKEPNATYPLPTFVPVLKVGLFRVNSILLLLYWIPAFAGMTSPSGAGTRYNVITIFGEARKWWKEVIHFNGLYVSTSPPPQIVKTWRPYGTYTFVSRQYTINISALWALKAFKYDRHGMFVAKNNVIKMSGHEGGAARRKCNSE